MKIADKDTAQLAKATYEMLEVLRGSELGYRLLAKLDKIEQDAITRAMHGKTPQDQNAYFEARGAAKAVRDIHSLFSDIDKEGADAVNYLAALRAKGKDEG